MQCPEMIFAGIPHACNFFFQIFHGQDEQIGESRIFFKESAHKILAQKIVFIFYTED